MKNETFNGEPVVFAGHALREVSVVVKVFFDGRTLLLRLQERVRLLVQFQLQGR